MNISDPIELEEYIKIGGTIIGAAAAIRLAFKFKNRRDKKAQLPNDDNYNGIIKTDNTKTNSFYTHRSDGTHG